MQGVESQLLPRIPARSSGRGFAQKRQHQVCVLVSPCFNSLAAVQVNFNSLATAPPYYFLLSWSPVTGRAGSNPTHIS